MPDARISPLSLHDRADLFTQLARLEAAGLPTDRALALIRLPGTGMRRLQAMRQTLARRTDLATAGERSGVFTTIEAQIIRAALLAGSPASSYGRLATFYSQRAAQHAAVRSRMLMPCSMLLAALFIQPLPALATGQITLMSYFLTGLRPLIFLGALYLVARTLVRRPTMSVPALDRLWLRLPVFGVVNARRNLRDFLEHLALLLEAGLPMFDALPSALGTARNSAVRQALSPMQDALMRGATLSGALAHALSALPQVDSQRAAAFVGSGEASGTLPEMLMRHAAMETAAIRQFDEEVATWLPRLAYALVVAWIAWGLIGGAGLGTPVPADL